VNRQKRRTTRKDQEGEKVVQLETFRRVLPLAAILLLDSSLLGAGESVISKVPDSTGKFCHLKFPAIKEGRFIGIVPFLRIRPKVTSSTSTVRAVMTR
jgi:hypothetical protein